MVKPALKREVVTYFMNNYNFSERKSCELIGIQVCSLKYRTQIKDNNEEIKTKLLQLSRKYPSAGYRMLGALLVRAGYKINHKRVYRLYKELELKLIKKKGKKLKHESRNNQLQVCAINDCWSLDFVSDRLTDGRKIRFLNIIDNYSRFSPGIAVAGSMPSSSVIAVLTVSINKYGKPSNLLLDNGPEFRSKEFQKWAQKNEIVLQYIKPGKPTQNAYIESFNGRFRAEFLDQYWFSTMAEVENLTDKWRKYYNENRPHSSLDYLTPNEFALSQGCIIR